MRTFIQKILPSSATPALQGGLTLRRNKPGLPLGDSIDVLAAPSTITIPLTNYQRDILAPRVSVGQHVKHGEMLATGVLASCSGQVIEIEPRFIIHPSGLKVPCVVIETDDTNELDAAPLECMTHLTHSRIAQCGIQGLGGAGFNTADKLAAVSNSNATIDTLIINAVECEPVISCDEALMMTEAANLVQAIHSVVLMSECQRCILAIEDDKIAAIAALRSALESHELRSLIEFQLLAPVYPSGAERPLIQRLTGTHLPAGTHAASMGIVCINISTVYAAWQAQLGYPMTSRVVTIAGEHAKRAMNVRVVLGTSVAEVLKQTGNSPSGLDSRVRAGGPLSGFDLDNLDVPVTATTNCITVEPARTITTAQPCIRCSACSEVCPVGLLPQQLHWFANAGDHNGSARFRLTECIECGCCDAVCPSQIALTQTFRYAKGLQRDEHIKQQLALDAETRYQIREQREAARDAIRQQKRELAKAQVAERVDPIADALSRVRRRRKPSS